MRDNATNYRPPASTLIGAMADKRIQAIQKQIATYQDAIRSLRAEITMLERQKADSEKPSKPTG